MSQLPPRAHTVQTLKSFVKEADLPSDTGAGSSSTVTIESILHEKKTFDGIAIDFFAQEKLLSCF